MLSDVDWFPDAAPVTSADVNEMAASQASEVRLPIDAATTNSSVPVT